MSIKHTVKNIKLQNGAEGLLIDAPGAPVAAYAIQFMGGKHSSLRTFPYQIGHTLEHIIERGPKDTKYHQKADYLRDLQRNGAWRNAFTGESGISYVGDCTTDELVRILELRISSLENPKLTDRDLKSETGNVVEEIRQRVVDYGRLATALARKEINNGEWLTSLEAIDHAKGVTLAQVQNFYEKTHTSTNLRFVIVGDISHLEVDLTKMLSSIKLPKGKRMSGSEATLAQTRGYTYEQRPRLENLFTSFVMALPRPLTPSESAVMQVVNNLLCNSWDSEILGKAREAGLCYTMRGYVESLKTQSIWALDTPISFDNANDFFALMSAALKKFKNGDLDEEAIERAKAFLIGAARKNGQTSLELLNVYSEEYFGLDSHSNLQDRINFIENVSKTDISQLVSEYTDVDFQIFSCVGSVDDKELHTVYEKFIFDLKNS